VTSHLAASRVSTARAGSDAYFARLLGELPPGRIVNVGAGSTRGIGGERALVSVDHVHPGRSDDDAAFVVADAAALPFSDQSFDAAIAKDVLEHVADPIAVLAELARVCRRGARLTAVVPRAIARAVWDDPTHVRGFTVRSLTTACRLSGWTPIAPIRRLGSVPGAGRLGMLGAVEPILRVPGLGHWLGTNWVVRAELASTGAS